MRLRLLILLSSIGLLVPAGVARADGGPIMPLSQVAPGMDCTGETVVQGTTISSFAVHVISVVQAAGEGPRILVQVSGPAVASTGVAEGFSGSPVYCPDAFGTMRNAGAISEGVGQFGNDVVLVTPIEQMLGEPVSPPSSAPRLALRPRPLLSPLTVGGLSPAFGVLQRAGAQAGRVVVDAPTQGGTTIGFPLQPMVPGASVAASYSSGAVPLGAVGTVTYVDGQTVYAFGHELDGAGRRVLLLQDAYVYYVVNNPDPTSPQPSFKLTSPGHTLGTISSDTPNAVIGELGSAPPSVPVDVTARDLDTRQTLELDSQVADETDVGLPLGNSLLDTIAPVEVAQAATQIYDGAPADESGRMCLRIYLRETRTPLGFCNRYVGSGPAGDMGGAPPALASATGADVASAFSALERVDFTSLHVQRVTAHLDAERGLAEASIVGAGAPQRVRPGQVVRVRLRVRVYRGRLRTVSFRLRIPSGAHGLLVASIRGPAAPASAGPAAQSLSGALTGALSISATLGPPQGPTPISSVAELRQAVAGIAHYDGLYAGFPGRGRRRVYRNRSLLITGQAALPFFVTG